MEEERREKNLGSFVAALRREKGWTQKELAERLHVTDKAVSKWERRVSMPDTALLIPLAETLGVSVTELLRGERLESDAPLAQREVEMLVEGGPPLGRGTAAAAGRTAKMETALVVVLAAGSIGNGGIASVRSRSGGIRRRAAGGRVVSGVWRVSVLRDPGCAAGLL